eukprot:1183600-Prorocentrum_minimum.AAC.2
MGGGLNISGFLGLKVDRVVGMVRQVEMRKHHMLKTAQLYQKLKALEAQTAKQAAVLRGLGLEAKVDQMFPKRSLNVP